ncbi:MAG: hypothetical protein AAF789_13925 [Bacteroidota bacterium]
MKAHNLPLLLIFLLLTQVTCAQTFTLEPYSGFIATRPEQANFKEEVTSLDFSPNIQLKWGIRLGLSYGKWMTDLSMGTSGFSDELTNRGSSIGRANHTIARSTIYRPVVTLRQNYRIGGRKTAHYIGFSGTILFLGNNFIPEINNINRGPARNFVVPTNGLVNGFALLINDNIFFPSNFSLIESSMDRPITFLPGISYQWEVPFEALGGASTFTISYFRGIQRVASVRRNIHQNMEPNIYPVQFLYRMSQLNFTIGFKIDPQKLIGM